MPRTFTFDPFASDIFNSRDAIERLEELRAERDSHKEEGTEMDEDAARELGHLEELEAQASGYGDWEHGEAIIPREAFVDHIKELIDDCYEIPKQTGWPYHHLTMDYEAAAEEAEQDYTVITVDGHDFLMRA